MKYSDYLLDSLIEMGFTHCFYLSGGNILHLLESASSRFKCIAVVNEVSAVIAADYFNVASRSESQKAFVLVTAGPGLTNTVTGIAGAWLDNREVFIVGGQSRSSMLAREGLKQLGHQEIGGSELVASITKFSHTITQPLGGKSLKEIVELSYASPKGPVFLEVCLDVSSLEVTESDLVEIEVKTPKKVKNSNSWHRDLGDYLSRAERPLILLGSGVSFEEFSALLPTLETLNVPIATSWNASDYLDFTSDIYAGRPGAYGMRWSNIVIQQADLVLAIGTRFSFWETGFNWSEFAPLAAIWSFNIDDAELKKPGPRLDQKINCDLREDFPRIVEQINKNYSIKWKTWADFVVKIKLTLPLSEDCNNQFNSHCNPFAVIEEVACILDESDIVVPCSSGGAYTTVMQGFKQKRGQLLTNNRGLASMGYGLAGAIGTCFARPEARVISIEGDGGFLQNLSEVSTAVHHKLNLKIFIMVNNGYGSIKISQKANFNGHYIGCDPETGVAVPDLKKILSAFGVLVYDIFATSEVAGVEAVLNETGPTVGLIHVHPDQQYFPKIASRLSTSGEIESNPIHLMQPELPMSVFNAVMKFPYNSKKLNHDV